MDLKIGICGIGVVGKALKTVFEEKGIDVSEYDKYKKIGKMKYLLNTDINFLCLPTPYSESKKEYDKSSIHFICNYLSKNNYNGLTVIKSTIEPGTCRYLTEGYKLNILHNPEFLSAKTAKEDFKNQEHIVIGGFDKNDKSIKLLKNFYKYYWKTSIISEGTYEETELMKICINSFYSVKIQFFNEIYSLSKKFEEAKYNNIVDMMLKNKWITPNHTQVPGTDGKLSYGGMCFPKDTNALYQQMIRKNTYSKVLKATIDERNIMRNNI
jgi:nucleotide sugar dehydrogenase